MSAQARRLWGGAGLALVLLAVAIWSLPAIRTALKPEAAPEIEADVCVVALPDIRIELRRGATTVSIIWPGQAVGECGAWLREWLR